MANGDVPQWLLDNLTSLDTKIQKMNDQMATVISLITDLRVKEASLQTKLDMVDRLQDVVDDLKKQEISNLGDLATIKVLLSNTDSTVKEVKKAQDEAKIEGVQLNTKLTVYIGIISFVVASVGSVAIALLTKYFGG